MMIKKTFLLVSLVLLGSLLLPTQGFSCGKGSKKAHHTTAAESAPVSTHKKEANCEDRSHSQERSGHKCPLDCNHSNCKCLNFSVTIALPADAQDATEQIIIVAKKQSSYNPPKRLSAGFHTVWLIPKIS